MFIPLAYSDWLFYLMHPKIEPFIPISFTIWWFYFIMSSKIAPSSWMQSQWLSLSKGVRLGLIHCYYYIITWQSSIIESYNVCQPFWATLIKMPHNNTLLTVCRWSWMIIVFNLQRQMRYTSVCFCCVAIRGNLGVECNILCRSNCIGVIGAKIHYLPLLVSPKWRTDKFGGIIGVHSLYI